MSLQTHKPLQKSFCLVDFWGRKRGSLEEGVFSDSLEILEIEILRTHPFSKGSGVTQRDILNLKRLEERF